MLVSIVYRDPEHVAERLALMASQRLGEPARGWARASLSRDPAAGPAPPAEALRGRTAIAARIDGAIAGTPFFIALLPGYLAYLWQEAQMTLRTAALYGRDPTELGAAADLLALRGVHPTPEAARLALEAVDATPMPEKPTARRSVRTWVHSVRMLLVFGGFLDRPGEGTGSTRGRPMAALSFLLAACLWVVTWVFPLTFMIAMAWSCESNVRELGRRAQAYYGGGASSVEAAIGIARTQRERGHRGRDALRVVGGFCSVAVPIVFVAYADHVRNTTGISWIGALGALVALSLVIATAVVMKVR
jgi:hypothetical protein